jgi:hypothetical protein
LPPSCRISAAAFAVSSCPAATTVFPFLIRLAYREAAQAASVALSSLPGLTRLRGPKPYERKYQPLLRRAKARQSIPLAFHLAAT